MTKKNEHNREPVSKKLRFEVFKRDGFVCQYCGNTPPTVVLEIDHIHPVSKGGKNSIDNLLTACFDCNRGKSNGLLTQIPDTLQQKSELLAEKELQLKAFNKLLLSIEKRKNSEIEELDDIFSTSYPKFSFNQEFKNSIKANFQPYINKYDLQHYMMKSCNKGYTEEHALKYFCGICWSVRRQMDES